MGFFVFFALLAPLAAVELAVDDEEEVLFETTSAGGLGAATPMGPAEERTARNSRVGVFLGAAPASAGVELMARAVPGTSVVVCCWSGGE